MSTDTDHGDETYKEASPLEDVILKMQEEIDEHKECIGVLQSLVNDLRWRMNALCNNLSLQEEARRTFK